MEFHHRLSHGDSPTGGLAANRDGQNTFPDYVLAKNQQSTPENLHLINAAEAGSLTGVLNSLQKGANPDYFFRSHGTNQLSLVETVCFMLYDQIIKMLCILHRKVGILISSKRYWSMVPLSTPSPFPRSQPR